MAFATGALRLPRCGHTTQVHTRTRLGSTNLASSKKGEVAKSVVTEYRRALFRQAEPTPEFTWSLTETGHAYCHQGTSKQSTDSSPLSGASVALIMGH